MLNELKLAQIILATLKTDTPWMDEAADITGTHVDGFLSPLDLARAITRKSSKGKSSMIHDDPADVQIGRSFYAIQEFSDISDGFGGGEWITIASSFPNEAEARQTFQQLSKWTSTRLVHIQILDFVTPKED